MFSISSFDKKLWQLPFPIFSNKKRVQMNMITGNIIKSLRIEDVLCYYLCEHFYDTFKYRRNEKENAAKIFSGRYFSLTEFSRYQEKMNIDVEEINCFCLCNVKNEIFRTDLNGTYNLVFAKDIEKKRHCFDM